MEQEYVLRTSDGVAKMFMTNVIYISLVSSGISGHLEEKFFVKSGRQVVYVVDGDFSYTPILEYSIMFCKDDYICKREF